MIPHLTECTRALRDHIKSSDCRQYRALSHFHRPDVWAVGGWHYLCHCHIMVTARDYSMHSRMRALVRRIAGTCRRVRRVGQMTVKARRHALRDKRVLCQRVHIRSISNLLES